MAHSKLWKTVRAMVPGNNAIHPAWGNFFLGLFLVTAWYYHGVLAFERSLPRRQKMGILLGMSVNLVLQFYGVESEEMRLRRETICEAICSEDQNQQPSV